MNSSLTSSSASSSSTCSGASSSMDSLSSESEELEYGPGIVAKLKSKFLKYSMKVDHPYRNGHSIPASCAASRVQSRRNALNRHNKLKRCSSVENILDDEQQQQQQESDKANSPINNENLIKPRPPLQSIHHSTAPVIKNYFFKSDAPATSPNHGTRASISSSPKMHTASPLVTSHSATNTTNSSLNHNNHNYNNASAPSSGTIKATMAAGVTTSTNSSSPAINGNHSCPGGNGRQAESSTTVNDDDSTSASSVVKKAKSMDSLEWQHGTPNSSASNNNSDNFKFIRDTNNSASDADAALHPLQHPPPLPPPPPPPQVPERTSICKGYNRETTTAKTAVVSPVLKLSPVTCASADSTSSTTTPTASSAASNGSGNGSPTSPNVSPNAPVAPGRRRSLTRGSTLPPVKPVIAQKPRPQHLDAPAAATATATSAPSIASMPLGPKPNVPPPMNQRPVPPPRAQKTLVASVSPLPATKTGTLVDTNNATNCLQATVTPPKPPVSPSASTTPLIATNSNSNISSSTTSSSGKNNNNNNNKHNSNGKSNNFDEGHCLTPASIASTKSITPTNVTMATCSLISKNNALNNKSTGDSHFATNGTSNGGTTSTINHSTPRSTQSSNPNVNVSNNNSNSKNDISRARSPCESTATATTQQKQSHLPSSLSNGVPEGVESKASLGKSSIINSCNSVVFDFRGKDVQPALGVTSPYGRSAVVDASDADDDYRGCMDIPPPCNITFQGENQIVGRGSLLKKRDKGLNISFDDTATTTFEYPSEQSLLQVEDSEAKWDPLRSGMFINCPCACNSGGCYNFYQSQLVSYNLL